MALSEYQKEQIRSLSGKTSADKIAEHLHIGRATVFRFLKAEKDSKTSAKVVSKPAVLPARDKKKAVSKTRNETDTPNDTLSLSPQMLATVAFDHLVTEMGIYKQAIAERDDPDEKVRSMAEWKIVNHEKLVQSAMRLMAEWFGMQKGDVLKAIEEIRADPLAGMTKEELLRLYEVTE